MVCRDYNYLPISPYCNFNPCLYVVINNNSSSLSTSHCCRLPLCLGVMIYRDYNSLSPLHIASLSCSPTQDQAPSPVRTRTHLRHRRTNPTSHTIHRTTSASGLMDPQWQTGTGAWVSDSCLTSVLLYLKNSLICIYFYMYLLNMFSNS